MGTKRNLQKYISNCQTHISLDISTNGICNIKGYKNYGDCNENRLIRQMPLVATPPGL